VTWQFRKALPPSGRRVARRGADRVLARPIGSIAGSRARTGLIGLTFDDGPDAYWTPLILDVLASHAMKATFFLLVNRAEREPGLVRRISREGHEIGLHGLDHEPLPPQRTRRVLRDLREGRRRLEGMTGRPIRYFRPPFGAQSVRSWLAVRAAHLDVVVWSADAEDWTDRPPTTIADMALERTRPGDIVLLHDGLDSGTRPGGQQTSFDRAAMVDLYLTGLSHRGLGGASVSSLLAADGCRRTAWFRP
jgi:peptidoglycan/xylan/chitin deacetylase (PgdA/CDA1 family)